MEQKQTISLRIFFFLMSLLVLNLRVDMGSLSHSKEHSHPVAKKEQQSFTQYVLDKIIDDQESDPDDNEDADNTGCCGEKYGTDSLYPDQYAKFSFADMTHANLSRTKGFDQNNKTSDGHFSRYAPPPEA